MDSDRESTIALSQKLNATITRPFYPPSPPEPAYLASGGAVLLASNAPGSHTTIATAANSSSQYGTPWSSSSGPSYAQGMYVWPQPAATPAYIELCVNSGRLCQSLGEVCVTHMTTDVELFLKLRKEYQKIRGWRTKWQYFLCPSSMDFVRFSLENMRVHIFENSSFPPEDEVHNGRYSYQPVPMQPIPAMPSNAFVHWLSYCKLSKDYKGRVWLDRLPKKLDVSVMDESAQMPLAWGMYVNEGIDVWRALGTMVVVITIILGPLTSYIVRTGDVQSALSVGSIGLTILGLLFMCMLINVGQTR